jgi:peptide/nickel transport system permease protein
MAWIIMVIYFLIAILSPFIANEKPILIKNEEGFSMPIFDDEITSYPENQILLNPLIPYSHNTTNLMQTKALPPLSTDNNNNFHFLGTDALGRDVMASLIRGAFISLKIAGLATLLALILGLFIGSTMAYFGDDKVKYNWVQLSILTISKIYALYLIAAKFFFACDNFSNAAFITALIFVSTVSVFLFYLSSKLNIKKYNIAIDIIGMRTIEIINSIPGLFIILFIMSMVSGGSITVLIITLGVLILPNIIRHSRAEALTIKTENYIHSAEAIGLQRFIIILKHIIPNIIQPILVVAIFGFMACILTEASLSFLGIGLPVEEMSWGKLLSDARGNINAWWLAVFPGIALFKVIWSLHTLREFYTER